MRKPILNLAIGVSLAWYVLAAGCGDGNETESATDDARVAGQVTLAERYVDTGSARAFAYGFSYGLEAEDDTPPDTSRLGRQFHAAERGFESARLLVNAGTPEADAVIQEIRSMFGG